MKILCIGDSNTFGYDPRLYLGDRYPHGVRWTSCLKDCEVDNRGINGMKVPTAHERYLRIIRAGEPDLVTVMLGTNDILSGIGAEQTANRMDAFIASIKGEGREILLIAPPHLEIGVWVQDDEYIDESCELAALYREVAIKNDCMFADAGEWGIEMSFDGVHFSEAGHEKFSEKLGELLKRQHTRFKLEASINEKVQKDNF